MRRSPRASARIEASPEEGSNHPGPLEADGEDESEDTGAHLRLAGVDSFVDESAYQSEIDTETNPRNAIPVRTADEATGRVLAGSFAGDRRARNAARRLEAEAQRGRRNEARATARLELEERRQTTYLPRHGETGPAALRTRRRFRVPAHRATSDVFGAAYPFLAEAGLGSEGVYVGEDVWSGAGFCFDPWTLYEKGIITNPNVVLAGVIGRGKSTLAKALATRSIAFGRRVYVPGDPKGEWSIVASAVGGTTIALGQGRATRLNPLDAGPRPSDVDDETWRVMVATRRRALLTSITETSLGRPLRAVEHSALDAALTTEEHASATPVLPGVVEALLNPRAGHRTSTIEELRSDGRELGHGLARLVHGDLAGLFDGPSTVSFNADAPMVTLDLSAISGSDTLLALLMTCASSWMEAALFDSAGTKRWVIYDEAWRLLREPALLSRMQSQWKLSRALGVANLMIVHRFSDLDAVGEERSEARALALGLLADCSTKIVYAQERSEARRAAEILGLSITEEGELPRLERGEGLWRIGGRSFVVRHRCTDAELGVFDTNGRMGDR